MPAYDYERIRKVADPGVINALISTGRQRGLSDDHILAALATGIVETNLRNLNHGDGSSVNWRQEVAKYYGSVENRMNLAASTGRFYDELSRTPRKGSIGGWAQSVQRSAHPERYDQAMGAAQSFLRDFGGSTPQGQPAQGLGSPAQAVPGVWDADEFARSMLDSTTGELRNSFDPKAALTSFFTSASDAVRSRVQAGALPDQGPTVQRMVARGDGRGASVSELVRALHPSIDPELVDQALTDLPPGVDDGQAFTDDAGGLSGQRAREVVDEILAMGAAEPSTVDVAASAEATADAALAPGEQAREDEQRREREARLAQQTGSTSRPAAASAPPAGSGGLGASLVNAAKRFLGVPYVWGGTKPTGLDCSGLMLLAAGAMGIALPRMSADQARAGTGIDISQAGAGDLIAFDAGGPRGVVNHIGMVIGRDANGQLMMIHAPKTGDVVKVSPVTRNDVMAVRRLV